MRDLKCLSKKETIELLEISSDALSCRSLEALKTLVLRLENFFSFEYVFCGLADIKEILTNPQAKREVLNIRYPEAFLQKYMDEQYYLHDPVFHRLFSTFQIQNWAEVAEQTPDFHRNYVFKELREIGCIDGLTYGVRNFDFTHAAVFSFVGRRIENSTRTRTILHYAVPSFSVAYLNLIERNQKTFKYRFTPRELEILKQLKEGKTSWEISMIINISERTVNFHIANLMRKLDAVKRVQAVAIALQNKIIEL